MSDDTTQAEQQPDGGSTSGYTPPATQQELNRIISERVDRERKKFGDYEDLRAKAARLDELEAANKSDIEKATEKVTAAEAAVAQIPAKVAATLRTHLVSLHQISEDDAELFLTATEPELLLKQVQRLVEREADRKKSGNRAPLAGHTPTSKGGDDGMREFTRNLFASSPD